MNIKELWKEFEEATASKKKIVIPTGITVPTCYEEFLITKMGELDNTEVILAARIPKIGVVCDVIIRPTEVMIKVTQSQFSKLLPIAREIWPNIRFILRII